MKDCVFVPDYFNLNDIHSYYMNYLFHHNKMKISRAIDDKKYFSIDVLREIYKEDKTIFKQIILELSLRGFVIYPQKKSNLFPESYVTENPKLILAKGNFNKVPFDLLKLSTLVHSFKIESSTFFMNIPLEGFKCINPRVNLEILEEELQNAGFTIKKEEDKNPCDQKIVKSDEKIKVKISMPTILNTIQEKEYLHHIKIDHVFDKNTKEFRFLVSNNIKFLYEIDKHFLELSALNSSNITQRIISKIKKELSDKNIELLLNGIYIDLYKAIEHSQIRILQLFYENKFNLLKNFLYKNQITYLYQFTPTLFSKFSELKGVGVGKLLSTLDVVYSTINDKHLQFNSSNRSEKKKERNDIYLGTFLSTTLFSCANDMFNYNIIDKRELSSLKIDVMNRFGKNKKVTKSILNEIDKSINEIKGLDIQFTKDVIKYERYYKKKTVTNIIESMGLEVFNEKEIIKVDNQFSTVLDLTLEEIEEQYQSLSEKEINLCIFFKSILWTIYKMNEMLFHFDKVINNHFNEREFYIYKKRIVEDYTLNEIGDEMHLTRERVRQIEKKLINKINTALFYPIYPAIQMYFNLIGDGFHLENEILFSKELLRYLNYSNDKKNMPIEIYTPLNLVCLKTRENTEIMNEINRIGKLLNPIIYIKDLKNMIRENPIFSEEIKDKLNLNIDVILKYYEYEFHNGIAFFNKINLEDKLTFVIEDFPESTINLSSHNDIELFRERYLTYFSKERDYVDVEDSVLIRKIRGVIERSDRLILKGPSTFMIYNYGNIPVDLMNKIYENMCQYFEENSVINYKKIYSIHEDQLESLGINAYMTYYLLKSQYGDDFDFGKGNTMNIYKKDSEKKTTEEIIYGYVSKYTNGVSKHTIMQDLGIENYTVDQTVSISNRLATAGGIVYASQHNMNKLPEKVIEKIDFLVKRFLDERELIPLEKMYRELKFDTDISSDLISTQIKDINSLSSVLKFLYPTLKGHTRFLFLESNEKHTVDLFLYHLDVGEIYGKDVIYNIGKEYGYADSTISIYLNEWIDEKILVEIDEDEFVLLETLKKLEYSYPIVNEYLETVLNDRKYISLYKIKGYRYKLPNISPFKWTPHLLKFAAEKCGFMLVETNSIITKLDPLIILNKSNSDLEYKDIIAYEISHYNDNLHETNVTDYFVEKGLIKRRVNKPNKLPDEVFEGNVISLNSIGMVVIND